MCKKKLTSHVKNHVYFLRKQIDILVTYRSRMLLEQIESNSRMLSWLNRMFKFSKFWKGLDYIEAFLMPIIFFSSCLFSYIDLYSTLNRLIHPIKVIKKTNFEIQNWPQFVLTVFIQYPIHHQYVLDSFHWSLGFIYPRCI